MGSCASEVLHLANLIIVTLYHFCNVQKMIQAINTLNIQINIYYMLVEEQFNFIAIKTNVSGNVIIIPILTYS